MGAVDYVTKPFEQAELRARVRAGLRTKRLQDILERQSFLDGLTGLWNRPYLDQRLDSELNVAQRYGRPLGLMMADIDHFKIVNDTYGHLFGDIVLQGVAEELRGYLCFLRTRHSARGPSWLNDFAPPSRTGASRSMARPSR
jgi:PleD family two-component response regulator